MNHVVNGLNGKSCFTVLLRYIWTKSHFNTIGLAYGFKNYTYLPVEPKTSTSLIYYDEPFEIKLAKHKQNGWIGCWERPLDHSFYVKPYLGIKKDKFE